MSLNTKPTGPLANPRIQAATRQALARAHEAKAAADANVRTLEALIDQLEHATS